MQSFVSAVAVIIVSSALRGLDTAETDTRLSSIYEPCAPEAIVARYSACLAISARLLDLKAEGGAIRCPRARRHPPFAMSRYCFRIAFARARRRLMRECIQLPS